MEPVRCPACDRPTAMLGEMSAGREGYARSFVPRDTRTFPMVDGVRLPGGFYACTSCGLVWSSLDPARLRAFIQTHGQELARQQLDEFDRGPYRDLPDTCLGREVGEMVADLDAHARGGTHLARRYRELRGVTWDQAIKVTGNWARLTRAEKLALLGWEPKKKVPVDDLDAPFP